MEGKVESVESSAKEGLSFYQLTEGFPKVGVTLGKPVPRVRGRGPPT